MKLKGLSLVISSLSTYPRIKAQVVQCVTLADGCDAGTTNINAFYAAVGRFQDGVLYGGSDPVVFSSALQGSTIGMVTYACNDGSVPPKMEGSVIRLNVQRMLSCQNICGGVASPSSSNCGFGVLIASNGANINCFSKAANVSPKGTTTTTTTRKTTTMSSTTTTTTSRTTTTGPANATPTVNQASDPWQLVGCMVDDATTRALANSQSSADMTVNKCLDLGLSYKYVALQGGNTCYWGDALAGAGQTASASDCVLNCAGKSGEACGGVLRNLLYEDTSYELIDIDGMIELLTQLDTNEKALLVDLQLWEQYLQLARADADSSQKRWDISPLLLASLVPTFSQIRLAATLLNTLTRVVQRKLFVWKRYGQNAFNKVIARRPQVVQEFELEQFNNIENNVVQVAQAATEIVKYGAEEAVELVATGALTLVGAGLLELWIDAFLDPLEWVRGLRQDYPPPSPPDPNDPDDPSDPPPNDDPGPDCPCDADGCSVNLAALLKRKSEDFEKARVERRRPSRFKRATATTYTLENCGNLKYTLKPYPSSSELATLFASLGLQPLYIDVQYYGGGANLNPPTTVCFWRLGQFLNPQRPGPTDQTGNLATYATEHVFDNVFLKRFFDKMVEDECVPCEDETPVQQPGQPAPAPTPGLNDLFFSPITAQGSVFQNARVIDTLTDSLTWFDPTGNTNNANNQLRWQEFFLLESRTNTAKSTILSSGTPFNDPNTQELIDDFIYRQARVEVAMEYLNSPNVAFVFQSVRNRLIAQFQAFDSDIFYGQLHPPIAAGVCAANWASAAAGLGWADIFAEWVDRLLNSADANMQNWQANTVWNIWFKLMNQYPSNLFPLTWNAYANFMVHASTPNPTWGVLAPDRFRFNRQLWNQINWV